MKILGLQKLTLLDYPGHLAAIVFLGGCNFRCPFCQNSSLVLEPETLPSVSRDEFLGFLRKRAGILEGICVTGGEPTLHPDLPELLSDIHKTGYPVKLDTNGTNPDLLQALIADGLVDYVAMDIKAGRSNYRKVCGLEKIRILNPCETPSDTEKHESDLGYSVHPDRLLRKICRSVDILKQSTIEYEFRTTTVRGLHTAADFEDIANWLSEPAGTDTSHPDEPGSHFDHVKSGTSAVPNVSPRYFLQSFRDCPEVLQTGHTFSAFSPEEMQEFLEIVQKKIPLASLRGI